MKQKLSTKELCLAAVFAAIVFVITRFIQIPIPLGYFNIGNSIILLSCILLPFPCGIFAGAIGSALADLTSYPIYTVPTLIIKAVMPWLFYVMIKRKTDKPFRKKIAAAAVSTLLPLFGYTAVGAVISGSLGAGLAQFPGLLLEYIANLAIFTVLASRIKGNLFASDN